MANKDLVNFLKNVNPTDMTGTLDTTGTSAGVDNRIETVSPIVAISRVVDLQNAADALNPDEGDGVDTSLVVTPETAESDADATALARVRIEEGLRQAKDDLRVFYDNEDSFPGEHPDHTDERKAGEAPAAPNTDMTGTLDTTGIGGGVPDATTVSAAAVEAGEAPLQPNEPEGTEHDYPPKTEGSAAIAGSAPAGGTDNPPSVEEPKDGGEGSGDPETLEAPPKSGEGSAKENWETYARSLGVDFPQDATKSDIISLVEASGKG